MSVIHKSSALDGCSARVNFGTARNSTDISIVTSSVGSASTAKPIHC